MDFMNIVFLVFSLLLVLSFCLWIYFKYHKEFSGRQKKDAFVHTFGAINSLFSGFAAVGIIGTLFLQYQVTKIDFERQKKQATIQMMLDFQKSYKPYELRLAKPFLYEKKDSIIDDATYKNFNDSIKTDARLYLSYVEHLSVGVNTGVFDTELIYWISGQKFITWYKKFTPCIKYYRKKLGKETIFSEFEYMTKTLEELQIKYKDRHCSVN
jgi:hypothetical protein